MDLSLLFLIIIFHLYQFGDYLKMAVYWKYPQNLVPLYVPLLLNELQGLLYIQAALLSNMAFHFLPPEHYWAKGVAVL